MPSSTSVDQLIIRQLESLHEKLDNVSEDVAVLKDRNLQGKDWFSRVTAIIAIIIALIKAKASGG
jgi:hypothetical protein